MWRIADEFGNYVKTINIINKPFDRKVLRTRYFPTKEQAELYIKNHQEKKLYLIKPNQIR